MDTWPLRVLIAITLIGQGAQNAVLRWGPTGQHLTTDDISQIEGLVSAAGTPRLWIVIGVRTAPRAPGTWSVDVYLTPDVATPELRRGPVARLEASIPAIDGYAAHKPWKLSGYRRRYAQVAVAGRAAGDLVNERGLDRPFTTLELSNTEKLNDGDLVSLVRFVRTSPANPQAAEGTSLVAGSPLAVRGDWPILDVSPNDATTVDVRSLDLRPLGYEGQVVTVGRRPGGWSVISVRHWAEVLPFGRGSASPAGGASPPSWAVMTILFAFVTILAATCISILFRQWHRGCGPPLFILGVLPIALLFFTVPVPPAIWQVIRGFTTLNQAGIGGIKGAANLFLFIDRGLFIGSIGFLMTMGAAAMLQLHAGRLEPPSHAESTGPRRSAPWPAWMLMASVLVAIPVALLVKLAQGVPRLALQSLDILRAAAPVSPPTAQVADLSGTIATRLGICLLGGVVVSGGVLMTGVITLLVIRSMPPSSRLKVFSGMVLAIVTLAGIWSALTLTGEVHWLTQLSQP
jgi:hypothetical protein